MRVPEVSPVKKGLFGSTAFFCVCLISALVIDAYLPCTAYAADNSTDSSTSNSTSDESGDAASTGTDDTASSTTPVPSTPASGNLIVVAFGDSVTAGQGGFAPYSAHLQNIVGSCATVVNSGVGGERTSGGVNRISNVLNAHHPTHILIMEGANDAFWGTSPATVKFNLGSMIDKARAAGATPILSTITPNQRNTGLGAAIPNDYNPHIRVLAAEKGVVLVDSYNNVIADWAALSFDGVHPNEAGAVRLAEGFSGALSCRGSGGGGGGGGCFIATAAFGTALEPQVVLLKRFRDRYLLTNLPGQWFVRQYYAWSPPVSEFIARHEAIRAVVRIALYPLVGTAYVLTEWGIVWQALLLLAGGFFVLLCGYGLIRTSRGKRTEMI